jgi:methyl-accepting chemotaxis protein
MFLRNFSIGSRLALAFGAILLLLIVSSLATVYLARESREQLSRTLTAATEKEQLAVNMKTVALEQSTAMRNIGLNSEIAGMHAEEDRIKKMSAQLDQLRDQLKAKDLTNEEQALLETITQIDAKLDLPLKQAVSLSTQFRAEEAAKILIGELSTLVASHAAELDKLIDMQRKLYQQAMASALNEGQRLAVASIAVAVSILVLAVLVAWTITRSITRPLAEAVDVARRVAAGNLTSKIQVTGRDEAALLLAALRDMNEGLGSMVTQIRAGAESIAVGAGQVAAGNQELSSRTEEHASSLEETASTLEEFTTTVRQNAEHAKQASSLAGAASTTAERGGQVVNKVVTTMQEVTESSKRISDIIAVIDGISFQTNILALNAAVEAARAGEQGRGFAVVASEVRSLAQRSAASAKEIRGLIETSVGRIEAGAKLVEQAGRTMDELVGSVRKVATIMTEIAAASDEQSSGIEQINRAITQMDNVVQMNASVVEQATAAATSMASQATGLARVVSQFRIDEGPAALPLEPRVIPAKAGIQSAVTPATVTAAKAGAPLDSRLRGNDKPRREPVLAADDEWKEF